MLQNILMAEIMPIVEEFDQQKNNGDRFIKLTLPVSAETIYIII